MNFNHDRTLGYRIGQRKVLTSFVKGSTEVYDLSLDPLERRDLATTAEAGQLEQERKWLATWAGNINRKWKLN